MNATFVIAGRQLRAYARTPTGPGLVSAFAAVAGLLFFDRAFFAAGAPSLATLFDGPVAALLALVAPAIATTALVDDRARGTLDLLLASPVSARQIALGKWLAGVGLWATCLLATLPVAMAVDWLGGLDLGAATAGYLGALALGALQLAAALAAAARARTPVNGLVAGALACGALLALGALATGRDLGAIAYAAAPGAHLAALARGIVPLASIAYFTLATAALLEAAAVRIDGPRLAKARRGAALALVMGLGAGAVLAGASLPGQLDLSSSGQESLTAQSRALAERAEGVEISAYFGNVPTAQRPARAAVERLLDRYARASRGRLPHRTIDPFEESPQFQQDLAGRGVHKLLWSSVIDGVPQQVPVYFHVEIRRGDRAAIWQPTGRLDLAGLEYEISSRLRGVVESRPAVAITTGFGSPPRAGALLDFLAAEHDAKLVDLSAQTETATGGPDLSPFDLVIVNGPRQALSPAALGLLQQHADRGKPLLLLVRGMSLQAQRPVEGGPPGATQPPLLVAVEDGLEPLLQRFGVRVARAAVVDATSNAMGAVPVGGQAVLARPLFPLARATDDGPFALPPSVPLPFAAPLEVTGQAIPIAVSSASAGKRTELLPVTARATFEADSTESGPFALAAASDGPRSRAVVIGSADLVGDPLMTLAVNQPPFAELLIGRDAVLSAVWWLLRRAPLSEARSKAAPIPMAPASRAERAAVTYGTSAATVAGLWLLWLAARRQRRRNRARQTF